jgi:hypothetical protein
MLGRNNNVVVEYSSLSLQQLVLFPVLREIVKSSADLIVLPEEVVRFQALKPRWEPRRALVCVCDRGHDPEICFDRLSGCAMRGDTDVRS